MSLRYEIKLWQIKNCFLYNSSFPVDTEFSAKIFAELRTVQMVQHGSEMWPPPISCSSLAHFYIFVTNNTKRELKTFCKVNKEFHHCQIMCKRILTCKHMLIQLSSTLYLSDEEGESWKDVRGEMWRQMWGRWSLVMRDMCLVDTGALLSENISDSLSSDWSCSNTTIHTSDIHL